MRFSYHTHTEFCDGKATAEAMAKAAFLSGYSILGFSSHAPLPFDTEWTMKRKDLSRYAESIQKERSRWEPQGMSILTGLEIDYIEGRCSPDASFAPLIPDYRIGSVHYVTGLGDEIFAVDEGAEDFEAHLSKATGGDGEPLWKDYYLRVAHMIEAGGFDILGHFDLVKKNNAHGKWFDEESKAYREAAFEAATLAGEKECIAEINTGGIARGKIDAPYPSIAILRRMRESGVRITLGDDAHAPEHLGTYQARALEAAKASGYRSLWYLDGERIWKEISLP
jgi:histidinol-phosphatase (PHP family)